MNLTGEPATGEIRADAAPETKYDVLQTRMFMLSKERRNFLSEIRFLISDEHLYHTSTFFSFLFSLFFF